MALVSGSFAEANAAAPRDQIYMARGFGPAHSADGPTSSGIGLLTANSSDEMLAPIYLPVTGPSTAGGSALTEMDVLGAAAGRFAGTAEAPRAGLAVVAAPRASGLPVELWLVREDPSDRRTIAVQSASVKGLSCTSCVLAAVDVDADGMDELLVIEDETLVVLTATEDGFVERRRAQIGASVRAIDDAMNPARHAPRPLVDDLDGDGHADVLLRVASGAIVVLWGKGDGTFTEEELFAAPSCSVTPCAGQAVARVGVDDTGKKKLVVVGPGVIGFYALDGRKKTPVEVDVSSFEVPAPDTDYVAVGAADLDGDGVDDLAIMPSGSSIQVFRGIPVHE
jgi:hypothetical protein